MKRTLIALVLLTAATLFSTAAAQSTAYVYLQGIWVNADSMQNPQIRIDIDSPYVEIGEVVTNVRYASNLNCMTDLRRVGEDDSLIRLTEHANDLSTACPNGTQATLQYNAANQTLLFQSMGNSVNNQVIVLRRISPDTDVVDHGLQAAPMPAAPVRAPAASEK